MNKRNRLIVGIIACIDTGLCMPHASSLPTSSDQPPQSHNPTSAPIIYSTILSAHFGTSPRNGNVCFLMISV
jgi:hypothetical protein